MKKAYKAPYIGTRAELKRESIRSLKQLVAFLNWYKGRAVICKNMIERLLNISRSWNYLTKQGLIEILTAWKNLQNRWKKSNDYQTACIGSEVHIRRDGKIYKRYIPAQKLWEARAIAKEEDGLWVSVRKAKRCTGFKWEVEVWHPNSEEDLLATVKKTYTQSGSYTKKNSPKNPFASNPGSFDIAGEELIDSLIEATQIPKKEADTKQTELGFTEIEKKAYDSLFGEEPKEETKSTLTTQTERPTGILAKVLKEVEQVKALTGWKETTNQDDIQCFSWESFEVKFRQSIPVFKPSGDILEEEILELWAEYSPGRERWFDITKSRNNSWRHFHNGWESLVELVNKKLSAVDF